MKKYFIDKDNKKVIVNLSKQDTVYDDSTLSSKVTEDKLIHFSKAFDGMYFVFKKLVPIYRNITKKKSKKELQNEINRTE